MDASSSREDPLPSYSRSQVWAQPRPQHRQGRTLALDDLRVYLVSEPAHPVYRLDSPLTAQVQMHCLQKVLAGPSPTDSDEHSDEHNCDVYSIVQPFRNGKPGRSIVVEGQDEAESLFGDVSERAVLEPSLVGWRSCVVNGHYKVEPGSGGEIQWGTHLMWTGLADNKLVAVEMLPDGKKKRTKRKVEQQEENGSLSGLPRLCVLGDLDGKAMDLLVACWLGRLWKETLQDVAEATGMEKSKADCPPALDPFVCSRRLNHN